MSGHRLLQHGLGRSLATREITSQLSHELPVLLKLDSPINLYGSFPKNKYLSFVLLPSSSWSGIWIIVRGREGDVLRFTFRIINRPNVARAVLQTVRES